MAKGSGTTRPNREGGLVLGDGNYKGKTGKLHSLKSIQNKSVYDALMDSISRFHSVLGVRQKKVKLADGLPDNIGGVHVTRGGESEGIYLNAKIFQPKEATTQSVAAWAQAGMDSGHLTKHNRAVGGIILHELGHAVWTSSMAGKRYQAAGKEIKELYRNFIQDKDKQFYGKYSHTSVNEMWAEICARSVSGYRDKYVDTVKHIIRKYGL